MAQAKKDGLLTPQQAEAGKKAEPIYETDPETGDPIIYKDDDGNVLSGQELPREGTGMVDLLGDTRQLEGQDRQAGFDESGQFLGLSALAEDIGRAGQQRAREADIADVERFGGRATEAYRAQGDLGGALATARAMGAGGSEGMSAIPSDPLFTGTATGSLADRARAENLGISAISGGRMGDYDPLSLAPTPTPPQTLTAPIAPTATAIQQQPQAALPPPRSTSAAQRVGGAPQGPVQPGSTGAWRCSRSGTTTSGTTTSGAVCPTRWHRRISLCTYAARNGGARSRNNRSREPRHSRSGESESHEYGSDF